MWWKFHFLDQIFSKIRENYFLRKLTESIEKHIYWPILSSRTCFHALCWLLVRSILAIVALVLCIGLFAVCHNEPCICKLRCFLKIPRAASISIVISIVFHIFLSVTRASLNNGVYMKVGQVKKHVKISWNFDKK